MDSLTHMQFAEALLEIAGVPSHLAIASLFPQIDRKPATLHRLYAHTVFKARGLTELGLRVLFGGRVSAEEQESYAYSRFREEGPRIWSYLSPHLGENLVRPSQLDAGILAFVSHLYLDTWNQPVQPFAPLSVDCAGQWVLWKRLGALSSSAGRAERVPERAEPSAQDSLGVGPQRTTRNSWGPHELINDFRLALYTTDAIHRLRSELFAHPVWRSVTRAQAAVLTQAMLLRLDDLSAPRVRGNVTSEALAALEIEPVPARDVRPAVDFLMCLEDVLGGLHEKHCANALSREKNRPKTVAVA